MNRPLAATVLLLLAPSVYAQTPDPSTQELIGKLMARIDALEKRVAELESERSAGVAAAAPPASQPPETKPAGRELAGTHNHDQVPPPAPPPPPEAAPPVYPSLQIAGFADIDFAASDLHGPSPGFQYETLLQDHSGLMLGQTTLHLMSALAPKVDFFSEITFTARTDAGTGTPPAPGYNLEVERLILRYDFNDYFKLSAGRFHTPINYWNTAFHHGQWLQTTISRPEMIQFGGSFLPVHFIGALGEGELPFGGLNLNYDLGVGNGRGEVIDRPGDAGAINNYRAWLANVFVRPNYFYGLQVGGSVYRDELTPLNAPPGREWIESAHIVWTKETPEVLAEFANVTHTPILGGPASNSQAWYTQLAYRLPWFGRLFKPYERVEQIHVPHSDAIFQAAEVPTFTASTSGVRYDFSSLAAFKLEYRYYWVRDLPPIRGVFSQVSFTF